MFGAKKTARKTARVRVPGHLAKTRRSLILLSSALTCAILVICLVGAWGIAARTSRQGNIAAMSDVVANSLELTTRHWRTRRRKTRARMGRLATRRRLSRKTARHRG